MASLDFDQEKTAFREFYSANQKALFDAEAFFRSLVGAILSQHSDINQPVISGRVKDREEAIKKFVLKYQSDLEAASTPYEIKDKITDLIGLRIVCLYEDDVGPIGSIISDTFEVLDVTDKIKKIESTENAFGYKGLHMDLRLNQRRRELPEYRQFGQFQFELQIRTIVQDAWSVLDHKIKYKKSIPAPLKRRINALAAQFESIDREFLAIKNASVALEHDSASNNATSPEQASGPLDAFQFLALGSKHFRGYTFSAESVDGFVQEILARDGTFSGKDLDVAISSGIDDVKTYCDSLDISMNPYTIIRHVLYKLDRERFNLMLFDRQRSSFARWIASRNS
jgi:putative GTP pyrophosphokinase